MPASAHALTGEHPENGVTYTYRYVSGQPNATITGIYSEAATTACVPEVINGKTVNTLDISGDMGTIEALDLSLCSSNLT